MNNLSEEIKNEEIVEEVETTEEVVDTPEKSELDLANEEVNNLSEEIKNEEIVEEVETTKEVVETPEKSELDLANERAEEFENKYLRAHAEMQNIQRRANEERQTIQRYRSQDLALQVEGLTEDVKKGLEMVQESLIQALKEEGVEEVATDVFDPNLHMAIQTVPATDDCPAEHIAQVLQKGYKLHERLLRPAMVVVSE